MNLFRFLEPLLTQKAGQEEIAKLQSWRELIFSIIMAIGSAAGLAIIITTIFDQIQRENMLLLGIYILVYAWVLCVTFIRRLPYKLRVGSLILILYLVGILAILDTATTGDGRIWLLATAMLTTIFIGGRAGFVVTFVSFATWLLFGWAFTQGWIPFPQQHVETMIRNQFRPWLNTGITTFAATMVLGASIAAIINNLINVLQNSRLLTNELEEKTSQLQEQTTELKNHSQALETSARISRTISSILDTEQLLYQTAKFLQEEYDLLHAGIFLVDRLGTAISLQASHGGGGKTVPAPGYQTPLEEGGLIHWVITNAQPRASVVDGEVPDAGDGGDPTMVTLSTGENPDPAQPSPQEGASPPPATPPLKMRLSDSQSHAVLPLRTREKVLGVIVLQSKEPDKFNPNLMATLQILTDQVAIQLDNVQLFTEREAALKAERRAYQDLSSSDWKEFLHGKSSLGYRRDEEGLKPLDSSIFSQKTQELPALQSLQNIPIMVRGNTLGYIRAQKPPESPNWTPSDKELLENLASRLEAALDTARLYEQTQQRAAYERLTGEVTANMRSTLDMETILKTAAQELRSALDLAEVEVRLGEPQMLDHNSGEEDLHGA